MKRAFDCLFALAILIASAPFVLIGAIGIKLTSPGPILYRAARAGVGGVPYEMYKLRTMHQRPPGDEAITAPGDVRVFRWGWLLRNSKIDELPQFFNILTGDMSFVGPRPEDPGIVRNHYTEWMMASLKMRPGITSPGTMFGFAYGDEILDINNVEQSYARDLLPQKLLRDIAYYKTSTLGSDILIVLQTGLLIILKGLGLPFGWIIQRVEQHVDS